MIEIRVIAWGSEQYKKEVELRYKILREPLGLVYTPQQLEDERNEIHIAAFFENEIIGCLLLKPESDSEIKMRQVAVSSSRQGMGIGKSLVSFAEKFAVENGYKLITLHSRDSALGFYETLGYKTVGEGFTEVTIPHHKMIKRLTEAKNTEL